MVTYSTIETAEPKHTCYECGLPVCETYEMTCEDCVAFEEEEGISYYEAMFNKPEGRA